MSSLKEFLGSGAYREYSSDCQDQLAKLHRAMQRVGLQTLDGELGWGKKGQFSISEEPYYDIDGYRFFFHGYNRGPVEGRLHVEPICSKCNLSRYVKYSRYDNMEDFNHMVSRAEDLEKLMSRFPQPGWKCLVCATRIDSE